MNLKNPCYMILVAAALLMSGCRSRQQGAHEESGAKLPVTVTGIKIRTMTEYLELTATSKFLNKSVISAQTSGYVRKVFHNPGERVKKGQELFTIQTKEAAALNYDSVNNTGFSGLILVKAAMDGMIISIDHPEGDFVMEGGSLGSISVPSSLVFILEAPYETRGFIRLNSLCEILLPDGDSVRAKITSRLPSMSEKPQTQQFIVKPLNNTNIPENLIARIRIGKYTHENVSTLPKGCILSDEVMKHFWVMKLVNDSTAVRTNITIGLTEDNEVEIASPAFTEYDLFLATGNYGIGDTASVTVVSKMEH